MNIKTDQPDYIKNHKMVEQWRVNTRILCKFFVCGAALFVGFGIIEQLTDRGLKVYKSVLLCDFWLI